MEDKKMKAINYQKPYVIAEIGCNHKGDMEHIENF